jgi:hypothetical protein
LNKPKPITGPRIDRPVKVIVDKEKSTEEARPTTQLMEEGQEAGSSTVAIKSGQIGKQAEDEDADAIEALQEIAHTEGNARKNEKESDEPQT